MGAWYDRIERFYKKKDRDGNRLWGIDRVQRAVECNKITETEYEQITGEAYSEE